MKKNEKKNWKEDRKMFVDFFIFYVVGDIKKL